MPDERAVMTYVSSYYHCFSGAQKVGSFNSAKQKEKKYQNLLNLSFLHNYVFGGCCVSVFVW